MARYLKWLWFSLCAVGAILAALMAIPPAQAISNLAAWLKWSGWDSVPAVLQAPGADNIVWAIAVSLGFAGIWGFMATWRDRSRERRILQKRRQNEPPATSTPQPSDASPGTIGIYIKGGANNTISNVATHNMARGLVMEDSHGNQLDNLKHSRDQLGEGTTGTLVKGGGGHRIKGGGSHNFEIGLGLEDTSRNEVDGGTHTRDTPDGDR